MDYQSKTIICIAHNSEIFKKFDKILRLDEGKIDKIGSYEDIVAGLTP